MPDGVIPALTSFVNRRRGAASIREVSAEELAQQREEAAR
jgi:branched-chain amino acid transport system permease protein